MHYTRLDYNNNYYYFFFLLLVIIAGCAWRKSPLIKTVISFSRGLKLYSSANRKWKLNHGAIDRSRTFSSLEYEDLIKHEMLSRSGYGVIAPESTNEIPIL